MSHRKRLQSQHLTHLVLTVTGALGIAVIEWYWLGDDVQMRSLFVVLLFCDLFIRKLLRRNPPKNSVVFMMLLVLNLIGV